MSIANAVILFKLHFRYSFPYCKIFKILYQKWIFLIRREKIPGILILERLMIFRAKILLCSQTLPLGFSHSFCSMHSLLKIWSKPRVLRGVLKELTGMLECLRARVSQLTGTCHRTWHCWYQVDWLICSIHAICRLNERKKKSN